MKKFIACLVCIVTITSALTGCGKSISGGDESAAGSTAFVTDGTTAKEDNTEKPVNVTESSGDEPTVEETVTEEPTTEEPTTEEPTTEEPTTEEPTTEPFVSTYSLLMAEEINPQKSGYEELDNLIDRLFGEILTDEMNKYTRVWTCYLYLVDNITYSRGMDLHVGEYSVSDASVTPVEVLWATDLLNSGQGCCYNYSAAFTFIMRALGYDAHLVTGNVPAYGGGVTPHCWLYVNLGGEKYSFDPDLDMNFHSRGENDTKDLWFGRKLSDLGYFYVAEAVHDI